MRIKRGHYRAEGESARPRAVGVWVPLRRVDLDALNVIARDYRRIGERSCNTGKRLAAEMIRADLASRFSRHTGVTLGEWILRNYRKGRRRPARVSHGH